MALADVVHHDVAYALCGQFGGDGLGQLLGVSVHAAVGYHHALRSLVAAQAVVDAHHAGNLIRPHRAVRGADGADREAAQLGQRLLHGVAILAHDVGVVARHFLPITVRIDARVQESTVQRAEAAEGVAGEEHAVRLVQGHHCLEPVHHGRQVEAQLVVSQVEEVAFLHLVAFACHAVESLYHAECLAVAHDDDVGIRLLDEADGSGMVRLHVVDDEVLYGSLADDGANLAQVGLEVGGVHRVHQGGDVVVYQVGIIGYAVGQRPHPLEEVLLPVVDAHVVDFPCDQSSFVHYLVFISTPQSYGFFFTYPYIFSLDMRPLPASFSASGG